MFEDDGSHRRKAASAEADLDITPMIDVTFLLLIFFMVTSTMQGTPDRDIPVARSGSAKSPSGMLELIVAAPPTDDGTAELLLDGKPMSLEEIKSQIVQEAAQGDVEVMVLAERRVQSGFIADVETMLGEVENVQYHFGVQEQR